jgi:hypothetical protein
MAESDQDAALLYNSPENATYLSPQSQNEMISIISQEVLKKVVSRINSSLCWTIMADESASYNQEYLSICSRHVHKEIEVVQNYLFLIL